MNIDLFPDYFYSQVYQNLDIDLSLNFNHYQQDLINDLKIFYEREIILENFLLKIFQMSIKLKNFIITQILSGENIPRSLLDIYLIKNRIMFGGQYFESLRDLIELKSDNSELKYLDNVKHPNGNELFYVEANKENLVEYFLNFDFEGIIKNYLECVSRKEINKLNNLLSIYDNFFNKKLSNFGLILFVISNNLQIESKDFYGNILTISKRILTTDEFISVTDINENDIENLRLFLSKYDKFKLLFLENSLKTLNFTLDYSKKNMEKNLLFLVKVFENDTIIEENKHLLNNLKPKLKQQLEIILLKKLNNSNEKYYRDYTIRLFTKKYLVNSKIKLEEFNLFNLFRNYFYNSKWLNIIKNFELINFIEKNSNILLYHGKSNKVIFPNNSCKDINSIIKNKFRTLEYLDSFILVNDFIVYNQTDLELILENYHSLSNQQLKNLSKIIYLSKFIDNNNYDSQNYNDFISTCISNSNLILTNNNFNLKIKEYLPKLEVNYGKIVRDIKKKNKKKNLSPFEENLILKKLYLKYRKKYSKYKAKFLLEKSKNNKNFDLKSLKITK